MPPRLLAAVTLGLMLATWAVVPRIATAQTPTGTPTPPATATATVTPTATATPVVDLAATVRQEIDARNRGDIAAAMAFWTDDAVQAGITGGGQCAAPTFCVGKVVIQRQAENAQANHTQITVRTSQTAGNVVTWRGEIRNDAIRRLGFDRQIINGTDTFTGNRISRRESAPDLTDAQTVAFQAAQQAAAATLAPPKTGNAGLVDGDVAVVTPGILALLALLALGAVGGGRLATGRRRDT